MGGKLKIVLIACDEVVFNFKVSVIPTQAMRLILVIKMLYAYCNDPALIQKIK